MYAFIEKQYPVTLINPHLIQSTDIVIFSYSTHLFPNFSRYMSKKVLDRDFILYQDSIQECKLKIDNFGATGPIKFHDLDEIDEYTDAEKAEIGPTKRTFGEQVTFISSLPLEKRINFLSSEAVVRMKVSECIEL